MGEFRGFALRSAGLTQRWAVLGKRSNQKLISLTKYQSLLVLIKDSGSIGIDNGP